MKQQMSTTFHYQSNSYELVKYVEVDFISWAVYNYTIMGRGDQVFSFTDCESKFNPRQAEHIAMHMLRMYRRGHSDGRKEIKKELRNLVDTDTV